MSTRSKETANFMIKVAKAGGFGKQAQRAFGKASELDNIINCYCAACEMNTKHELSGFIDTPEVAYCTVCDREREIIS